MMDIRSTSRMKKCCVFHRMLSYSIILLLLTRIFCTLLDGCEAFIIQTTHHHHHHHHLSPKNLVHLPHRCSKTYSLALLAEKERTTKPNYNDTQEKDATKSALVVDVNESSRDDSSTRRRIVGKEIFALAVPAFAGLAIDPLMTLADTAFIGRSATNADALAGVGSAAALLTFSFYIFNFLCTATTPLVSQRRASGQEENAQDVGGQALSLAFLLGTTLTVVLLAFGQSLLQIMGTSNTGLEANEYAMSFFTIRTFAAPAIFISSAATGILRGYLDTKTAFVILLMANIVNFTLDVILIPGLGMGPTGAAIATTTAEWICAISFLGVLSGTLPAADSLGQLGSNQQQQHNNNNNNNNNDDNSSITIITPSTSIPPWEDIKPLIVASSSVFLRSLSLQIALAGATAMAARGGNHHHHNLLSEEQASAAASVAAHQIAVQLWLLCSFVCDALAAASQALVADSIGRSDSRGVTIVSQTIFYYSLGLGLLLAAALEIGSQFHLMGFFTSDAATQSALAPLLTLIILAQPLNSFVFAADGVLQGASEFTYQAKTMLLSVTVGISSFYAMEYFGYQQPGTETLLHVWYGLIILQFMRGITSTWKLVETKGPINLLGAKKIL